MSDKIFPIERMKTLHEGDESTDFVFWFLSKKERYLRRTKARLTDDMGMRFTVESVFDEEDKRLVYETIEDKDNFVFNVNLDYLVEFRSEQGEEKCLRKKMLSNI